MKVKMEFFASDCRRLQNRLKKLQGTLPQNMLKTFKQIGLNWAAGAVERVPVDTSNLKQHILANTKRDAGGVETAVGTNVEYGKYVEFGTDYIAQGRVKQLGDGPDVTDSQAVVNWPAKNRGIVDEDTGKANARVVAAIEKRFAAGRMHEQMPWLRPAFNAIRKWAVQQIIKAVEEAI